jgi:hypothetical protein
MFRPVGEKNIEMFFTNALLRSFRQGRIEFFAPTTNDEETKGFDAGFQTGAIHLRIQFKAPDVSCRGMRTRFRIHLCEKQHGVLHD